MAKKILIVEDDTDLRDILVHTFKEHKYKVYEAENGKEAYTLAELNIPDIILLDILMPVMDGFKAFEQISKIKKLKKTKIIFLTNWELEKDHKYAKAASGFIPKNSITLTNLHNVVESIK